MQHFNPNLIIDVSSGSNKIDLLIAPSNQILICKDLVLHVDLTSIPMLNALPNQLDLHNPNITIPAKEIVLWTYKEETYLELDRILVTRYTQTYRENLMSYLSQRDQFVLAPGGRLAMSVRDIGTGVLGSGDYLRIFGHAYSIGSADSYDNSFEED